MRKSFTLFCSDRASGKGEWLFERYKNGINVFDPNDELVFWFPHEMAEKHFALPSFWRSIKNIQFTAEGLAISFEPHKSDVKIVRHYLDDALLSGGLGAVTRYRNRALVSMAGGFLLFGACVGGVYWAKEIMHWQDQQARRYARPFMVGFVFGAALFAWGLAALFRYGRLLRRWNEEESSPNWPDSHSE
jgi:hypothetical protein